MKELIERYKKRIESVNKLLYEGNYSARHRAVLIQKRSCYRGFIVDLERELNYDKV